MGDVVDRLLAHALPSSHAAFTLDKVSLGDERYLVLRCDAGVNAASCMADNSKQFAQLTAR